MDSWSSTFRSLEQVRSSPPTLDLSRPPGVELREVFDAMPAAHRKAKLYQDWATYEASLPVISISLNGKPVPQKLHMLQLDPSDEKEVLKMSEQLLRISPPSNDDRYGAPVKLFKKPKSSIVLPAFLAGRNFSPIVYKTKNLIESGFTHYLHVACHDNGERTFQFDKPFLLSEAFVDPPWRIVDYATSFIFQCIKTLLDDPDNLPRYVVKHKAVPRDASKSRDELRALINTRLGEDSRVLIHIDGLSKVSRRDKFLGAAYMLPTMVSNVAVVATDSRELDFAWVENYP